MKEPAVKASWRLAWSPFEFAIDHLAYFSRPHGMISFGLADGTMLLKNPSWKTDP